ncbi:MAG: hypothetical protein OXH49_10770 [Gemmatimonadetes bacterium]|nr:hypothetical protein [Gemmatimonadota bacterium]
MGKTRLDDSEFDRRLKKDVKDNWAGILVDGIVGAADGLHVEFRRLAQRHPEIRGRSTDVDPLVKRIRQDAMDLKRILGEHDSIPVLSRRRAQQ